jgi:hypothetical protein
MSTATTLPGTGADSNAVGTVTWTTPGNVTAEGAGVASAALSAINNTTHYLKATSFGFAVPGGATVTGVEVEVSRTDVDETESVTDFSVRLVKGGVVSGDDKASGDRWPAGSLEVALYGSDADLWGLTLTPADVNASTFGAVVSAATSGGAGSAAVDFIRVTVHYTTASGAASATVMLMGGD